MPILLLDGSPREGGNTEILLNRVLDGIHAAGGEAELLHLRRMRIAPCAACDLCKTAPRCAIDDDMAALYPKLAAARRLVIGAPIYFYGLPAQAKALVDRCQFFWNRRFRAQTDASSAPPPRRYGHFVAVAATHGPRCFDGARLTLRALFATLGLQPAEELLVRGVDERGAVAARGEALDAAFALGQRVAASHAG